MTSSSECTVLRHNDEMNAVNVVFTLILAQGVTFLTNQAELQQISTLPVFDTENGMDTSVPIPAIGGWEPSLAVVQQTFDLVRLPDEACPTQFPMVYKFLDYLAAPPQLFERLDARIDAMQNTPFASMHVSHWSDQDTTVSFSLEHTCYLKHYTYTNDPVDIMFIVLSPLLPPYRIDRLEFHHLQNLLFVGLGAIIQFLCIRPNQLLRARMFSWISRHGWIFTRHGNPTFNNAPIIPMEQLVPSIFFSSHPNMLFLCSLFKDLGIGAGNAITNYKNDKLSSTWLTRLQELPRRPHLDHLSTTTSNTFPILSKWQAWESDIQRTPQRRRLYIQQPAVHHP